MGCAASIVLLQAFRSVVQRNCPHICRRRRREELSHEFLLLDSDDEMSRPRTLIIMVWYTLIKTEVAELLLQMLHDFFFFPLDYIFVERESTDRQFVSLISLLVDLLYL